MAEEPGPTNDDLDGLRQLLHEVRTPLNAIGGFAELIDRQVFGPAARRHREAAAVIGREITRLNTIVADFDAAATKTTGRIKVETLVTALHDGLHLVGEEQVARPPPDEEVPVVLARLCAALARVQVGHPPLALSQAHETDRSVVLLDISPLPTPATLFGAFDGDAEVTDDWRDVALALRLLAVELSPHGGVKVEPAAIRITLFDTIAPAIDER